MAPKVPDLSKQNYFHPLGKDADITSAYGMRNHPLLRRRKFHTGTDLRAKTGDPVYAPADGKIVSLEWKGGYGRYIRLESDEGPVDFAFGHLSAYATVNGKKSGRRLRVGDHVKAGQLIGRVGSSGRVTGPHLHFETFAKGAGLFNPILMLKHAIYNTKQWAAVKMDQFGKVIAAAYDSIVHPGRDTPEARLAAARRLAEEAGFVPGKDALAAFRRVHGELLKPGGGARRGKQTLSPSDVMRFQQAVATYSGKDIALDGKVGPETRRAARDLRKAMDGAGAGAVARTVLGANGRAAFAETHKALLDFIKTGKSTMLVDEDAQRGIAAFQAIARTRFSAEETGWGMRVNGKADRRSAGGLATLNAARRLAWKLGGADSAAIAALEENPLRVAGMIQEHLGEKGAVHASGAPVPAQPFVASAKQESQAAATPGAPPAQPWKASTKNERKRKADAARALAAAAPAKPLDEKPESPKIAAAPPKIHGESGERRGEASPPEVRVVAQPAIEPERTAAVPMPAPRPAEAPRAPGIAASPPRQTVVPARPLRPRRSSSTGPVPAKPIGIRPGRARTAPPSRQAKPRATTTDASSAPAKSPAPQSGAQRHRSQRPGQPQAPGVPPA